MLHTRLAVIDPAGGKQPMTLQMGNRVYQMVYNGELYNTQQLRQELKREGHSFCSHCDTEVLLHSFVQWGEDCLNKLNGIFAFAVWEEGTKRLFLARDRMGVKPLFFKRHDGGLLFASEIKTILAYPTVKAELDAQGAAEILLLGPGRSPGCGVLRGIEELEPGCCGWYEGGVLRTRRYWYLRDREHRESFEETAEQVRYLVTDAIRRQTVSDVPIGTFLSGGLDSSLISAVCAGQMGSEMPTFSLDYADNDRYFVPGKFQPNSDNAYIRIMQDALQTRHHWCVLTPEDLMADLENAVIARDLPGMADVDISLLAFCRQIRTDVKVAISGECADEIFGGYPWYRDPAVRETQGFPWAQNIARRQNMLSRELRGKLHAKDYILSRYERTCRESDILPGTTGLERRMKEMTNLNIRWFMQTLLDRKDRMSMYSGLEVRVPFCDHRIAEYLYGVPWEFKDYQGREKGLLRRAMGDFLPEAVRNRKKSPYPKTHDPRYGVLMADALRTVLEDKNDPLFALVDHAGAQALLEGTEKQPWYGQLMQTPQTVCYLLQLRFWLKHYGITPV